MEEKVVEQIHNFIPKKSRLPQVLIVAGYIGVVLSIMSGVYIFFMTQTLGSIFRELKTEQTPQQVYLGVTAVIIGLTYAIFQIYYGRKLKKLVPLNKRERNIGIIVFLLPLVLSLFTFPATVFSAINPIMKVVSNAVGNSNPIPTPTSKKSLDLNSEKSQYFVNDKYGISFSYPMRYQYIKEENNTIYLGEGGMTELVITTNRNDFNSEYTQIRPCAIVPFPENESDEGECLIDVPGTTDGILITQIDTVPAIRFTIHHMVSGFTTTIVQTTQSPNIEITEHYLDTGPRGIDYILPTFKFMN